MKKKVEMLPAPCRGCIQVADRFSCENKNCPLWQKWFLERWDKLHAYPRQRMEQVQKPMGVCVGGRYYVHPDQLRAYLKKDPCRECVCDKALCKTPCRARKIWEEAKREANQ